MNKLLEDDRDLSEMRNANSDLRDMLERAFVLGRMSAVKEAEPASGVEPAAEPAPAETPPA